MGFGELRGDAVLLRPISYADFVLLDDRFQDPALFATIARWQEYSTEKLYRYVFLRDYVQVWSVLPEADAAPVAYAVFSQAIRYFPQIGLYFFDRAAPWDEAVARDALVTLAHACFAAGADRGWDGRTDGGRIDLIVPAPVPAEVHDVLTDCGFDPEEESDLDPSQEALYALYRHTYTAYFGEQEAQVGGF